MTLLFDQNLSFQLVTQLSADYPGSAHVRSFGFAASADDAIWSFAAAGGFAIVTKDADFQHRALLYGPPPKVIWLRIGNGSTSNVASLLRARKSEVEAFGGNQETALLVLP